MSGMVRPLQLEGGKLPPVPRAGFAAGDVGGKGARAARYVHKIGTSPKVLVFRGSSAEGVEIQRRDRRDKLTQQVVNSLNRCGREKQAKALATCGEWFDVWARPSGQVKLLPCPCDSMFCPECANRRSRPLIRKLKAMVNRPGRSYWFLTLTVPNTENLSRYDISEISDQFAALWNSWVFQEFEDEGGVSRKIYGGVRSIECVYEQNSKSWHPHIHVLFEAPKRLPPWWLTLLKTAWNCITGGARYLRLQRAYTVTKRGVKKYNHLNEKALREVCKYVTKCAEFAGDHLLVGEFLSAFKGVRRVQCFGSFHGKATQEFCREPGEDDAGVAETENCLRGEGYVRLPFRAHIGDTEVLPDGTRQLTFEFMERVTAYVESESPPWELTSLPEVSSEQKRLEFAGAMPEKSELQPSLFGAAA
ncbi:MAG TPA: protein rep [Candidatus Methylomirabilis sp.]|nr:protein rep [Candidatus Methylomirabilis sp.]